MMHVKGYMGAVELADGFVIVSKRLRGENRIPLAAIQSVEIGPAGPGMKFLRFATAASVPGHRPALGSHKEVAQDPNAITFRSGRRAEFEEFAAAVRAAMGAPSAAVHPAGAAPPPGWYPDPDGAIRWWDGQAWGPGAPTAGG